MISRAASNRKNASNSRNAINSSDTSNSSGANNKQQQGWQHDHLQQQQQQLASATRKKLTETVKKLTTHGFARKFTKNSSERRKTPKKNNKNSKKCFLSDRFPSPIAIGLPEVQWGWVEKIVFQSVLYSVHCVWKFWSEKLTVRNTKNIGKSVRALWQAAHPSLHIPHHSGPRPTPPPSGN